VNGQGDDSDSAHLRIVLVVALTAPMAAAGELVRVEVCPTSNPNSACVMTTLTSSNPEGSTLIKRAMRGSEIRKSVDVEGRLAGGALEALPHD